MQTHYPGISPSSPERLLVIDIDGLRQDVFHHALASQTAPALARLLGITPTGAGHRAAMHVDPVSTAPSITFCAQSSIFTGRQTGAHGIAGNQFFDRFGARNGGTPRFYAFDVGDTLSYDDAVLTFSGQVGLVGETLAPGALTLYERAAQRGLTSTVVYNMVSRGATRWIRPSLLDIARFTKGGGLVGLSAAVYDTEMMDRALDSLTRDGIPDILTVYFMGLDHTSHEHGPDAQAAYLARVVDAQLSRLEQTLREQDALDNLLVLVVSDHGQIEVIADDRHSLRMSFPFDRELAHLFDSLGLDVNDKPREGHFSDAVVAVNGGMAHLYLRRRDGFWSNPPRFSQDVLPVAQACWEAHATGRHAPALHGALAMVLVRDVEQHDWESGYQALDPGGRLMPVEEFLLAKPDVLAVDAPARLHSLAGPMAGDVLLVSNYAGRFYFGAETTGVHGGLHPEDSLAVGSFAWPGAAELQQTWLQQVVEESLVEQRRADGCTRPSIAHLAPVIERVMGWF